jgi:hypothetical protein
MHLQSRYSESTDTNVFRLTVIAFKFDMHSFNWFPNLKQLYQMICACLTLNFLTKFFSKAIVTCFSNTLSLRLKKTLFLVNLLQHGIVWSCLPDYVVSAPSINSFKNRLDEFCVNQSFKFNWGDYITST